MTLALAGCSDILGGGESVPIEEVHLVDDDGSSFILARLGGAAQLHMAIAQGYTQHVRFRFTNQNGVPVPDPEAYSVNVISIANPAVFAWQPEAARSGFFKGVANGYTTFRVDVLRGDSVVYHSARLAWTSTRPRRRHSERRRGLS